MIPGERLTLDVEKPAAGGRMIARRDGAVVLVAGAIPGERVEATVEKVQRGTVWARTTRVLEASADRIEAAGDTDCGGNVFAHVRYERQLALKAAIIGDALTRIGRLTPPGGIAVLPSPTEGYRMRARLHAAGGRLGFFREGTHQLCDPAGTRQLLSATLDVVDRLQAALSSLRSPDVVEVEIAENRQATERALHLVLRHGADPSLVGALPELAGVTGVSCGSGAAARALALHGRAEVTDELSIEAASGAFTMTLTRHVRSFFQGNRFLLPALVAGVVDTVPSGRVLDLYAGVGLFAVALARRGDAHIVAVEGDRTAAHDLKANSAHAGGTIETRHQPVEAFLAGPRQSGIDTAIVDPPRTGMTKEALASLVALRPARITYVSCDVATLGRDARALVDAGYRLTHVRGFDLFPNTAHVESLATFER